MVEHLERVPEPAAAEVGGGEEAAGGGEGVVAVGAGAVEGGEEGEGWGGGGVGGEAADEEGEGEGGERGAEEEGGDDEAGGLRQAAGVEEAGDEEVDLGEVFGGDGGGRPRFLRRRRGEPPRGEGGSGSLGGCHPCTMHKISSLLNAAPNSLPIYKEKCPLQVNLNYNLFDYKR